MSLKRSLTLLCKLCLVYIAFVTLQSCSNIAANEQLTNIVYIAPIAERSGMLIRNNLLPYFPNQDTETTKFIVNVKLKIKNDLYLTNRYGYATKGETKLISTLIITDRDSKKVLLTLTSQFTENFNIEPTGYAARKTQEFAEETTAEQASKDIKIKIYSFLQRYRSSLNNPSKVTNETTTKTNP